MTSDPWLLVAQRHFQDMRDVADRDRLAAMNPGRTSVVSRIARIVASTLKTAFRPSGDEPEQTDAPVALEYQHSFVAPDGTVSLVDAADRASATDVHHEAQRLVHVGRLG